jgi:hypothetical protein
MAKTIRELTVNDGEIWVKVDQWAQDHESYLQPTVESGFEIPYERNYRTRQGVTMMPVNIKVIQVGSRVRLEGWIDPGEVSLESRSMMGGARSAGMFGLELLNSLERLLTAGK